MAGVVRNKIFEYVLDYTKWNMEYILRWMHVINKHVIKNDGE